MSSVAAARTPAVQPPRPVSREDFHTALDHTLRAAAADERLAPIVGATGMRLRFRFTDCDLTLDLAAAKGGADLSWSFGGDPGWSPALELEMDTATANRFLQGRESLAIAIARGRVRVRGGSRAALAYLPVTKLFREPYLRVVEAEFPDLVAAGD